MLAAVPSTYVKSLRRGNVILLQPVRMVNARVRRKSATRSKMATTADSFGAVLSSTPQAFLQPSLPLYTDTLAYLKHALDPLAVDVSAIQEQRQQDARKKRKRGERLDEDEVLRLRQIHTDGFALEQVWEQARRIIDAARVEAERGLERTSKQGSEAVVVNGTSHHAQSDEQDEAEDDSLGEEGVDYEIEGVDDDSNAEFEDGETIFHDALQGDEDLDMLDEPEDDELGTSDEEEVAEEFVPDKFGLNDGFFSIDDFNKKSDFLEQQDARGENDGAASDEEDVDWDADPITQAANLGDAQDDAAEDGDDDDDDDDGGPIFGDPDALSEEEDSDAEGVKMDVMGDVSNTNSIMYKDFFAPPAQKKKKNKKGRPNPHNFPKTEANGGPARKVDDEDEEIGRTIAGVHRDLFEDDQSSQEEDEVADKLDPSDPRSRRSTHERRRAALAEEIRKLEAANIAKREWTLSGEARAADRPLNSLLEEDLDFERAGKPVPVITAEISESIEDLVKRRILAHDFQDIIRRRPDDLATGKSARRGRLDMELDDSKSKKGLAEEYEEEHLRTTDPNYVDARDEKQKAEEKEIEALWKKVSADLDSLSSWHFRPKQPAPQLDIRVDAPAIGMEDARPSAGNEVAGASQLAPQEVYRGGEAAKDNREEVTGKSGLPAGREELTREERKRRRRRDKERGKKAGMNVVGDAKKESKSSEERKEVVGNLKRSGAKVIGKKGEMTDVGGRTVVEGADGGGGQRGGGRYKL